MENIFFFPVNGTLTRLFADGAANAPRVPELTRQSREGSERFIGDDIRRIRHCACFWILPTKDPVRHTYSSVVVAVHNGREKSRSSNPNPYIYVNKRMIDEHRDEHTHLPTGCSTDLVSSRVRGSLSQLVIFF